MFATHSLVLFALSCLLGGDSGSWQATLVEQGEAGEPMVIEGALYQADGVTPLAHTDVFIYHACKDGDYHRDGQQVARIHGNLRTDAQGRFRFTSIRPGSYPSGGVAAHVHVVIKQPGQPNRETEFHFMDDPQIRASSKAIAEKQGKFRMVIVLEKQGDTWHGAWNFKL